MKVVIDLIEDIRESINNSESYNLTAMLLKEEKAQESKLIYAGEAPIGSFRMDESNKILFLEVDKEKKALSVGELVKHLLILDMDKMMYEVKILVSSRHPSKEVVGFGFNATDAKYVLFIMA